MATEKDPKKSRCSAFRQTLSYVALAALVISLYLLAPARGQSFRLQSRPT